MLVIWPPESGMVYKQWINRCCLYFSRWSKKGYSIFVGLGREVRISRLSLSMYTNVLLKSASSGLIVNTDKVSQEGREIRITLFYAQQVSQLMGKVYPDESYHFSSGKGYIAEAVYPFYLYEIIKTTYR